MVSPKINLYWSIGDGCHYGICHTDLCPEHPRTKSALRWCAQQQCCPFVVKRLLPARRCEILFSNPGLITSFKRWVISDISQIHSHRTASHLGTRFMNLISGHCKLQQHVMGHDMSRYVMVRHNAPLQESNHTKPAGIKGTRSLSHVRVVDCQQFLKNFWKSIETEKPGKNCSQPSAVQAASSKSYLCCFA